VNVSQKRRGTLITSHHDQMAPSYHDHWLRTSRTKHILHDNDVHSDGSVINDHRTRVSLDHTYHLSSPIINVRIQCLFIVYVH
jgi:acetyl-CoA carboxylase beta subunit